MNMPAESMAITSLLDFAGEAISPKTAQQGVKAVLEKHNLDWEVMQEPVYSELGQIQNTFANYRSDNKQFLGLVSSRYQILNNYEAFQFIDELDNFTFDRAGYSSNGSQVFIVGKTLESFEIDTNDRVVEYLTFIHGHDGSHGIKLIISPIRTFCTNQLNLLLARNSFSYSITHIGDLKDKLEKARLAITSGSEYMNEVKNILNSLRDQKLENFNILAFAKELIYRVNGKQATTIRQKNKITEISTKIADLYNNKDDNQNYKGTKLGVLNAVSDYISHVRPQSTNKEGTYTKVFLNNIAGNKFLNTAYHMLLAV